MVKAIESDGDRTEAAREGLDQELDELFSQWQKDRDKLAARRQVEQYLELRRLREQMGDLYDLEDL